MSMARCDKCEEFVDTDFDPDCYDNPEQQCICAVCREDDDNDTETAHTVWQAEQGAKQ